MTETCGITTLEDTVALTLTTLNHFNHYHLRIQGWRLEWEAYWKHFNWNLRRAQLNFDDRDVRDNNIGRNGSINFDDLEPF